MPRLDYNAIRLIHPVKFRTLKDINDEAEFPVMANDLILKAITMKPGASAEAIKDITGLARGTITKGVGILKGNKLITKVKLSGPKYGFGNGFSTFFYPVA